ncbi:MAG: nucleoside kinase [Clostridia bacterium]|nr:nucleoside kinase [Clostridia bacterium]
MRFTLDSHELSLEEGATYLDATRLVYPENPRRVLGIRVKGMSLPLDEKPREGEQAASLTVDTEEGRRIYERSLRFVMLYAMKRLYPSVRVRVENSTQHGVYITVEGMTLTTSAIEMIDREMRHIIAEDMPYERFVMTREDAQKLYRDAGEPDKMRLLEYRPFDYFTIYRLGDMYEYFYGEMPPSTGYAGVFALYMCLPGIQLQLPDPEDPSRESPFSDSPKLRQTFAESSNWARILDCDNISDLNDMIRKRRLREFIRVNEALHEKSISDIADKFTSSGAQVILIAGPSSSGKTTFAHRLMIQLKVRGLKPVKISLDDYYIDRDKLPLEPDGTHDLEKLETLDIRLFNDQLVALLQGELVELPIYDFTLQKRVEKTHSLKLAPGQPIVIEGIHALNDRLTCAIPRHKKFLIYISALTTLNMDDHNRIRTTDFRLLRRMVRDHHFRNTTPDETLKMWDSVRNGERKYILPYQESCDVMFNSTLHYEAAVLKKYAYPMLCETSPDEPYYTRVHRLIKFLNYVQSADVEDEIPVNSILREFIGGCCFYYEDD